jgi:hypothetical protein
MQQILPGNSQKTLSIENIEQSEDSYDNKGVLQEQIRLAMLDHHCGVCRYAGTDRVLVL